MKPTIDRDTHGHVSFLHELATDQEWQHEYSHRYAQSYISCPSCSETYWDNGTGYRDKNGKNPYYNAEDRKHSEGCRLEAAVKFLRPFLDIENELLDAAERAEEEAA